MDTACPAFGWEDLRSARCCTEGPATGVHHPSSRPTPPPNPRGEERRSPGRRCAEPSCRHAQARSSSTRRRRWGRWSEAAGRDANPPVANGPSSTGLRGPRRAAAVGAGTGAGALAPYLAEAHIAAHPSISRVLVWNRTRSKSAALVARLRDAHPGLAVEEVGGMDEAVAAADTREPIVRGELLRPGAHLDLVGSFTPEMRECDDEALRRGRVFIDFEAAMEEAGELVDAAQRGVLRRSDVAGTLAELAAGTVEGRRGDDEITVFKSVGTAVVDLLAAQLAYETHIATTKNA